MVPFFDIAARSRRHKRKPTRFDYVLGQRLRAQRQLRGMTQGMLGAAIGVSLQQVQKYERGSNRLCTYRLLQMAHALHIPVTELLYGEEGEPAPTLAKPSAALRELLQLWPDLLPAQQRSLCRLASDLVAQNA